MSAELNDAARAKANVEAQLAEYRAASDDKQRREMDELKKSKEEDLERLRRMYEEHLNGLKGEINILLEENEKVKMFHDKLENENRRYKSDLSEISSDYDKALKESVRWEKEASNLKSELNNVCDENDNYARHCEALEDKHNRVTNDLDRMTTQYERAQTENTRLEKELQAYDDLVKKLDEIQEERTLESRYTEALVKQRDNMNAIIESTQQETEEMKSMIQKLSESNKQYVEIEKEFNLQDASAVREALTKVDTVKERLEVLTRERERYNATIKALKIDLTMLHGADAGNETSLQEHMRLLNDKWESNETRLKQADKVKSELNESIQLLEENSKERENMKKEHNVKVSKLERDLKEAQASLIGMERDHAKESSKQSEKVTRLEQDLAEAQTVLVKMERDLLNLKKVETENRDLESLKADAIIEATKKKKLEDELGKLEESNKDLQAKLDTAYFNLEETQRTLSSLRQDHEDEMQKFETELSKISNQKGIIESQETEIRRLKDKLSRSKRSQSQDMEDAQNEVAESYKLQIRMLEEKYDNQERRNSQRIVELERALKEQKESLEQKSMAEVKRRGEFAKQRQELEILRSKERHLETHINQLEEHISKVVADYENKLQSSGRTVCSNDYSNSEEIKAMRKQVRELEKKLEVSSAAMKQLGKSSLLMEKENARLKSDKNELKSKLKKLVDCAEKFGPK
jgi:chromosome segregation ATPase